MKVPIYVFLIGLLVSGCATSFEDARGVSPVGRIYYTRVNIWYEYPDKISSTNYVVGTFIPLGTGVKILGVSRDGIRFTRPDRDISFAILFVRKHNPISLRQLFDRYFSDANVLGTHGEFHRLTAQEQESIVNGKVFVGMSKNAVLMSLGYPPAHRTPNLNSDIWLYWGRRVVFSVCFQNDLISKVDTEITASLFETRSQVIDESIIGQ